MGLKAMSQTIEPLMNGYQTAREKQMAKSILAEAGLGGLLGGLDGDDDGDDEEECWCSPVEMAMHRYIILLLMCFSSEGLLQHLARLSREILSHPTVSFATQVFAAFNTDDYGKFLRLYRQADFLTAVAMSGVADLARLRALYLLLRTYPQPIGDKVSLGRIKEFLSFGSDAHVRAFLAHHKVRVQDDPAAHGGGFVVLPKKGTPEASECTLLSGPAKMPEKCDFPQGPDSMLVAKFEALGLNRLDIVFGAADPVVVVEEGPTAMEVDPGAEAADTDEATMESDAAGDAAAAAAERQAQVAASSESAVEATTASADKSFGGGDGGAGDSGGDGIAPATDASAPPSDVATEAATGDAA